MPVWNARCQSTRLREQVVGDQPAVAARAAVAADARVDSPVAGSTATPRSECSSGMPPARRAGDRDRCRRPRSRDRGRRTRSGAFLLLRVHRTSGRAPVPELTRRPGAARTAAPRNRSRPGASRGDGHQDESERRRSCNRQVGTRSGRGLRPSPGRGSVSLGSSSRIRQPATRVALALTIPGVALKVTRPQILAFRRRAARSTSGSRRGSTRSSAARGPGCRTACLAPRSSPSTRASKARRHRLGRPVARPGVGAAVSGLRRRGAGPRPLHARAVARNRQDARRGRGPG